MDGLERRVDASIRSRLSLTLCIAILVMAGLAGGLAFETAFDRARHLQDEVLLQVASIVSLRHVALDPNAAELRTKPFDEDTRVIVQRLGATTPGIALDDGGLLPLPTTLPEGLQTLRIGEEDFRTLVKTLPDGERIAVSQEQGGRDRIAVDGAIATVVPMLVLVPILLFVVSRLIRTMFQPIESISAEIETRGEHQLHPIPDRPLPTEVRPFVAAINRLLVRTADSVKVQRRFVADAAHELRSPLAALSLQAELLADTDMSAPARDRLVILRRGIERGRNMLEQLLGLARAQSDVSAAAVPVSVQTIFRRVLEDLMPLAEAKQLDVGVVGGNDATVWASEFELHAVVKNLVDNAIRYTPANGRVDLSVTASDGHVEVRVQDTGPGIPPHERSRVFDPFYRALGTEQFGAGLGLSIVRTIAEKLGATVQLAYADEPRSFGLRVTMRFPAQRRPAEDFQPH